MKKNFTAVLLAVIMLFSVTIPALAFESNAKVEGYYEDGNVTVVAEGLAPNTQYLMIQVLNQDSTSFKGESGTSDADGKLTVLVKDVGALKAPTGNTELINHVVIQAPDGKTALVGPVKFDTTIPETNVTVTFDPNGGTLPTDTQNPVTVEVGKKVALPVSTRDGYTFDGWYDGASKAVVDDEGNYEAIATVTLTAHWTPKAANVPVTGVTLDRTSASVSVGSTVTLTATVTPADATDKTVTWTSSNPNVATVDSNGKVTGVAAGTATITVTTKDGSKTASCTVTVTSGGGTGGNTGGSSGGGGGVGSSVSKKVSVNSTKNGSVSISPSYPSKGNKVTLTAKPNSGYVLDTIKVLDSKGNEIELTKVDDNKYTFIMPDGKVTVDAKFVKADGTSDASFSDVSDTHWAIKEITWAAENGIMNGIGGGQFAPDRTVTRQQLWMVMARLGGSNPADMAAARSWAMSNNISDGTRPGEALTRQQLVAILYRYANLMGYPTDGATEITTFPDHATVSDYAKDAMAWAVGNGIVAGTSDGRLNPGGTATRAQFAVIMYRFDQKFAG